MGCLRDLAQMVAEGPGDPAPLVWISEQLTARGYADPELAGLAKRQTALLELEEQSLARARAQLKLAVGAERAAPLRQLAIGLRGRVQARAEYLGVLEELIRILPEERVWSRALERALRRTSRSEDWQAYLVRAAQLSMLPEENAHARVELARWRMSLRDPVGALETLRPLLAGSSSGHAWCHALCYAALSGERRWRAHALLAVSAPLAPSVRGELACVAADDLLKAGEHQAARAAAEQALFTSSSAGRAVVTLARIAVAVGAPDAAQLVERALGVAAPRGWLCETLARAYSEQDEPVLALSWTQRWLSLRPGNLAAIKVLLARGIAARDAERLEAAIVWLLGEPLPMVEVAPELARALDALGELSPDRAEAAGRRVLDAIGPRSEPVREALLELARRTGRPTLGRLTLQRSIPLAGVDSDSVGSLLELEARLAEGGEVETAYRTLARASQAGASPQTVIERLEGLPAPSTAEAILARLEARAVAWRALGTADPAELAQAWREYGGALWDLAEDYSGALGAWRYAAGLDPEFGNERLVRDLWTFAGPEQALAEVEDAVGALPPDRSARLCSLVARLQVEAGRRAEALVWAERALGLDPSEMPALAVAEQVANTDQAPALGRIYHRLGEASLGRYGERAIHYRAARQLELLGAHGQALEHAALAFEAMPSTGIVWDLLTRVAQRVGRIDELVATVERVISGLSDRVARAAWLRRLAARTGPSEEGLRHSLGALLGALSLDPDRAILAEISRNFVALTDLVPEERDIHALRIRRALVMLLPSLDGPQGARTAIVAGGLALDTVRDPELGVMAIARALRADPSLDEYAELKHRTGDLAAATTGARELVGLVLELGRTQYGNLGRAALELGRALAELSSEPSTRLKLGLLAVARDPGDLELLHYIEQTALSAEQPELLDQARRELDVIGQGTGDEPQVLCVLARLAEQAHDPSAAARFWLRSSSRATHPEEAEQFGRRGCEVLLFAGNAAGAREAVLDLGGWLRPAAALELKAMVERKIGDPRELGQALEEYAGALRNEPARQAALLVEAARLGESAGLEKQALERAREAARLDPRAAGPQLIARLLEYRRRGPGEMDDARSTLQELGRIEGSLSPAQRELLAFLRAEALRVVEGPDSARAELERALGVCGPRPLVAASLAESLAPSDPTRALPLFDAALKGDLRGLKSHGQLAVSAALAAQRVGELERGIAWLKLAAEEDETRAQAQVLENELRAALHAPETPIERLVAARLPAEAPSPKTRGAMAVFEVVAPRTNQVGRPLARRPSLPAFPPTDDVEARLVGALANGSVEAGIELFARLENRVSRSHDLLSVCRQLSGLAPGDRQVLSCLHEAALANHNPLYARAVEHVRRTFSPGEPPLAPPSPAEQREQPERIRSILARDADVASEALGLVWDNASQLFRRELAAYGVTGMERIHAGAPTPLGRLYGAAARLLGVLKTPLFQSHDSDDVTLNVALTHPPAVLLSGQVRRESSELAYHLGAMLGAAMPERVLLFGLSEAQARDVLQALAVGFGPPTAQQRGQSNATHLAEVLWQSTPGRAQRRLRELCDDPDVLEYEPAMTAARRVTRRAGLLVSGDLGVAVRETLAELEVAQDPAITLEILAQLASAMPEIADLVCLATSPEYAEVRWQSSRGGTR